MDTLALLGSVMGLSLMSGINLYATVFMTGLAIRMEWVALPSHLEGLAVLGRGEILVLAGLIYTLEFFSDKIPWVDNLWDVVHTFIRPLGAVFIILAGVSSDINPVIQVILALLGGTAALTTHATKAGSRTAINAVSPVEPVSNILVSLGEDAVAVGGTLLALFHPVIALGLAVTFLILFIWLAPALFRLALIQLRILWALLRHLTWGRWQADRPMTRLPAVALLAGLTPTTVKACLPCFTGRFTPTGRFRHGWLIHDGGGLAFLTHRWWQPRLHRIAPETVRGVEFVTGAVRSVVRIETTNGPAVFRIYKAAPGPLAEALAGMRAASAAPPADAPTAGTPAAELA